MSNFGPVRICYFIVLLWPLVTGNANARETISPQLDRLIELEVEQFDLLEGEGSDDSQVAGLLRDGYWPSENAEILLTTLAESRANHGIHFTGVELDDAIEAYEAVRDARRAIRLAQESPSTDTNILVGLAVGALSRAREAEKDLVRGAKVLMARTHLSSAERSKRAKRTRILRFLRNPVIDGLFPWQEEYLGVLAGLKRLKGLGTAEDWAVKTTEERFSALGWGNTEDSWAMKRFQGAHQLEETGVLDLPSRNVLALSLGTLHRRIQDALRRWHRSPIRHEKTFYRVNIPAFTAQFILEGEAQKRFRVVVGDREGETPEFTRSITSIVLNPAWYVPDSVRQRDLKKRARKDPGFYKKNGFRKIANGKKLVQKPGPENWLGRVIFRWDRGGTDSVFVHDSPFQERFNATKRAMSHGCVNMENALDFAKELASRFSGVSEQLFERKLKSGKTKKIKLKRPLPAFLDYMTVVPGPEHGQLVFLPDVYERVELDKGEFAQQW